MGGGQFHRKGGHAMLRFPLKSEWGRLAGGKDLSQ